MNILNEFKKKFFYRQHPEAALRYLPIVELLKKEKLENSKILEVGSGSYGITPYIKRRVIGLDTNFDEPVYPLLSQVKGSADNIPFKDLDFDVVILSDVLEHLPGNLRAKSLNEAIRVAKKAVVISGPFGSIAASQDKKLANYSLKKLGSIHPFFKDHLLYGLPKVEDVKKIVKTNTKVKNIQIIGEYFNLDTREWLMKFFITKNKLVFYFYLKGLMLLVPLLKFYNKKPCYRTLILIKIRKSE